MKKMSFILAFMLCTTFLFTSCGHKRPDAGYLIKSELKDAKVGIVQGITTEAQVNDNIESAKITVFNTIEDGVTALKEKEITALVLDAKNAKTILEKNDDFGQMADKLIDKAYLAATMIPDANANNDFTLQVGATLSRTQATGVYDTIYNKYFNGEAPDFSDFEYNVGKVKNRTLVVGVAENNKPFSYLDKNGRYIGFDVEFANEVAKLWGATLEVRAYPRKKLVNIAKSGEVTMAMGRLTSFDDKDKSDKLLFSLPYFDASQIILLNKEDVGKIPFNPENPQ